MLFRDPVPFGELASRPERSLIPAADRPAAKIVFPNAPDPDAILESTRETRFSFRTALISLVVLVAVLCGIEGLHSYHVNSFLDVLKTQAEEARDAKDYERAYRFYQQYLSLIPGDLEVSIEAARAVWELDRRRGDERPAVRRYEAILRQDNGRSLFKVREELVEILLESGRVLAALDHLNLLLQEDPENGTYHGKRAFCLDYLKLFHEAASAYEQAILFSPNDFKLRFELARLYIERLDRPKDAEAQMERLVAQYSGSSEAHSIRGQYRLLTGQLSAALVDARTAFGLNPNSRDTLLLIAELMSADSLQADAQAWFDIATVRRRLEALPSEKPEDQASDIIALTKLDLAEDRRTDAIDRLTRGVQEHRGRIDLEWLLVDLLTVEGRYVEASDRIEELRRLGNRPDVPRYLEARIEIGKKKWRQAATLLAPLRSAPETRAFLCDVYFNLGRCQRELGLRRDALISFEQALRYNGSFHEARWAACDEMMRLGRLDDAIQICEPLAQTPFGAVTIARLKLEKTLRLPAAARNWSDVEPAINLAANIPAARIDADLMRLDVLVAQGRRDDAAEFLQELQSRSPADLRIAMAVVRFQSAGGDTAAALEQLEKVRAEFGASGAWVLAAAAVHAQAGEVSPEGPLPRLLDEALSLPEPDRWEVLADLARMFESLGMQPEASRAWREVATNRDWVFAWQARLRHAIAENLPEPEIDAIILKISEIEAGQGAEWNLAQARRLANPNANIPNKELRVADHLRQAVRLSTKSLPVIRDAGFIAEQAGLIDEAIAYYDEFVAADQALDPELIVLRRLVDILTTQRRYRDAYQALSRSLSKSQSSLPAALRREAAAIALMNERRSESLTWARNAVDAESTDYRDHLWYGRLLASAGELAEAKASFERAVALSPDRIAVWIEYARFLNQSQDQETAAGLLERALVTVPPADHNRLLANCFEAVEDYPRSLAYSRAALEAAPDDLVLLAEHAALLTRLNLDAEAEAALRKGLTLAPAGELKRSLERTLALVLSRRGDHPALLEARALAEGDAPSAAGMRLQDQLLLAHILGASPFREWKMRATVLLGDLSQKGFEIPADSRMLWVQTYLDLGKWEDANWTMKPLLGQSQPQAAHLLRCVTALLAHGESGESARVWLDRLKQVARDADSTIELSAWLALANGNAEEAANQIYAWSRPEKLEEAEATRRRLKVPVMIAELARRADRSGRTIDSRRLDTLAERLFRENIAADAPQQVIDLARLLGRSGRTGEAMDAVQQTTLEIPREVIGNLFLEIVRGGSPPPEVVERLRHWRRELNLAEGSNDLLAVAADLAHSMGDYTEAMALYRQEIQRTPLSLRALNELAYLEAAMGDPQASLGLIDTATAQYGPLGFLLDSRALAHLNSQNPDAALLDAEAAIADQPTATHQFRKVQVLLSRGDRPAAESAWRLALTQGLYRDGLHPLERNEFDRIEQLLRSR